MLKQNESLTKAEIVQSVYKGLPIDSEMRRYLDLVPVVDLVFEAMINAILDRREVVVRGFGTIKPVVKKPRTVMDFKSKKSVPYGEQKTVKFVLSKKILDELNPE